MNRSYFKIFAPSSASSLEFQEPVFFNPADPTDAERACRAAHAIAAQVAGATVSVWSRHATVPTGIAQIGDGL